jgi:acyl-CoA thioester hydrolase
MPDPTLLREVARVRVIFADTDQMGMVYYGNYLRYFEIARNELLRQAGATYRAFEEATQLRLPVVEAHVHYRQSARYDDELGLRAAVPKLGGASARFVYQIQRLSDGQLLVDGYTVHACIDRAGKLTRLPRAMRDALSAGAAPPPPAREPGT